MEGLILLLSCGTSFWFWVDLLVARPVVCLRDHDVWISEGGFPLLACYL